MTEMKKRNIEMKKDVNVLTGGKIEEKKENIMKKILFLVISTNICI